MKADVILFEAGVRHPDETASVLRAGIETAERSEARQWRAVLLARIEFGLGDEPTDLLTLDVTTEDGTPIGEKTPMEIEAPRVPGAMTVIVKVNLWLLRTGTLGMVLRNRKAPLWERTLEVLDAGR